MYKTRDIGFAAFLLEKDKPLINNDSSNFSFDLGQSEVDDLQIEYVNSGYESFHSNLKLLLSLRKKKSNYNS